MAITKVTTSMKTAPTSAEVSAHATTYDDSDLQNDIALLGFKVASNDSSVKYNLANQFVDDFQDASGISAGDSTNEARDSSSKYYKGQAGATPTVTGGNTISIDGSYTVHKFTSSGTYTTDTAQDVEYLVVGGGGSGGGTGGGSDHMSGGGGAGGYRTGTGFATTATSYSITVGTGGVPATDSDGGSGVNSIFSTITSAGGGGGGGPGLIGIAGGSGGGGSFDAVGGAGNTPSTSPVQGYAGGNSGAGGSSGGGGGSSAVGEAVTTSGGNSGAGGAGTANDIVLASTNVTYGGGGGGGKSTDNSGGAGAGGTGGGGAGGAGAAGTSGTANTGGGGGGAGNNNSTLRLGGAGGTGIVVIRRLTSEATEGANLTLVSTSSTAEVAPTKGDLVFSYSNGAGTATYTGGSPTIQAFISRNGAAYSSAVTLSKVGTAGGNTILAAHDVDLAGITAGTAMRYKITTTGQSASMRTRIHAVSLGWS